MASNREGRRKKTHFKLARFLTEDPTISTREIAQKVGIFNEAAYYFIIALIEKRCEKLRNFT